MTTKPQELKKGRLVYIKPGKLTYCPTWCEKWEKKTPMGANVIWAKHVVFSKPPKAKIIKVDKSNRCLTVSIAKVHYKVNFSDIL